MGLYTCLVDLISLGWLVEVRIEVVGDLAMVKD